MMIAIPGGNDESHDGAIRRAQKQAFLRALAVCGTITHAADSIGIYRSTYYGWIESDEQFAAAARDSMNDFADSLELEATRRARTGVSRVKTYQGKIIMVPQDMSHPDGKQVPLVEHEFSDTLLIFLLKGLRPEKYRDNHALELSGGVNVLDALYSNNSQPCLPSQQP